METVLNILILSAPLLLTSFGALISEKAGRMAIFVEGIINLGAFFCFMFTVLTKSTFLGVLFSTTTCIIFITLIAILISKIKSNYFLISLATNLICSALITIISVSIFGTRGVLTSDAFLFNTKNVRLVTTICAFVITGLGILFFHKTKIGLQISITGTDEKLLTLRKINTTKLKILSWIIAAFYASFTGCIMAIRLSSFVPNISSGTGWLALATIFLGKKNTLLTVVSVFIFSIAQFLTSNIQNYSSFRELSSGILLSCPYIIALLFIFLFGKKNDT